MLGIHQVNSFIVLHEPLQWVAEGGKYGHLNKLFK